MVGHPYLKEIDMPETINSRLLAASVPAKQGRHRGSLDVFEMTAQPNARMPIPHYHDRWDETILGETGTPTFRIEGRDIAMGPGHTVFIKRGVVHGFTNQTQAPATCLCVLTPGVLGPGIFPRDRQADGGRRAGSGEDEGVMLRYGLHSIAAGVKTWMNYPA